MPNKKPNSKSYALAAVLGIVLGIATVLVYYYFVQIPAVICYGNAPSNYTSLLQHAQNTLSTGALVIVIIDVLIAILLYQKMFSKNLALLGVFILLLVLGALIVNALLPAPACYIV